MSIESFINRNKWEYCSDGCSVTKDGDAPPLQLAYENLSSPVAHSSRTAFEGGDAAFGYTASPVVAAKDRFWSAWKGSSRDEFIKIFAEEAQLMIFDDCAETGKVMTLQGLDGAGMMFDHFLAGTSPYHTGWSLPAEYFNRVGIFGFGFDCAATRPCWFSSTVVLTESDTSEPKILFLLGSWERWNAPDSFSCARPQPAPAPPSIFESYLAHVQERNFSAIRASSVQDDPGMRYSTSEPGGGNTHSIETFYGQWNSVGAPSLKMSRLVDNVATVPKFGFALWGGRRMRGTTDIIHYLVHEMVLFTDSGEIKSIESFINRNKWEYCPDGCSVTKDGDAPPLQLAYENLSSPVAHSSRTAFEGGETAFGYTSSPVVAAKDRFWSAWKGSSRDEFIKIFAEEAQLMIFDDCAETEKVMKLQGLDGAGMMFDHFLAGTSPYHTGWSLPAEYFNRVGIFGFGFDCAATRPCW